MDAALDKVTWDWTPNSGLRIKNLVIAKTAIFSRRFKNKIIDTRWRYVGNGLLDVGLAIFGITTFSLMVHACLQAI